MKYLNYYIFGIFCVGFSTMFAQERSSHPELITDRPDATESSKTVPLKSLQLEIGAYFETFDADTYKINTYGYNTSLLRYGLLDNLELRAGWNIQDLKTENNLTNSEDLASGFSPLLLGIKLQVTEEKGLLPQIALIGHLELPFLASQDYRPEATGVNFRFSFSNTLSEKAGLGYNLGAQWDENSLDVAYVYTLVYGYSISDKLGAYAEVYGDFPEDASANHYFDLGLTYLVLNNFQLDFALGRSFTEGQDLLIITGFSFRIPN